MVVADRTSIHDRPDQVWIRVVGLPLQLWSKKISHEIGNLRRDGLELKKKQRYEITSNGQGWRWEETVTLFQTWWSCSAREGEEPPKTQRSDEGTSGLEDESLLGFTEVTGHVSSSYDPKILNWPVIPARHKAHVAEVPLSTPIKRDRSMIKWKKFGLDLPAQFVSNRLVNESSSHLTDSIPAELEKPICPTPL